MQFHRKTGRTSSMLSRHLTNGRPGPMDTDRCRHPTAPRDGKQMVALETNLSPFGMVHLIQTTRVTREAKFCFLPFQYDSCLSTC